MFPTYLIPAKIWIEKLDSRKSKKNVKTSQLKVKEKNAKISQLKVICLACLISIGMLFTMRPKVVLALRVLCYNIILEVHNEPGRTSVKG